MILDRPEDQVVEQSLTDLAAEKVSVRLEAVTRLTTPPCPGDPEQVIPALVKVMRQDKNDNVRSLVAQRIVECGGAAIAALLSLLQDPAEKPFIRVQAALSLGRAKAESAASPLASIVAGKDDEKIRFAAVTALESLGTPAAGDELVDAIGQIGDDSLRARAVTVLGTIGSIKPAGPVIDALLDPLSGPRTAAAAIAALPKVMSLGAIPRLSQIAQSSAPERLRERAVVQLGVLAAPETVEPLIWSLLVDSSHTVRACAAEALSELPPTPNMVTALVECGEQQRLQSSDVETALVALVLGPANKDGYPDGTTPISRLLDVATAHPTGWPYLATLILAASGDATRAGQEVNEFEQRHGVTPDTLRWLRIELGGTTALDPILAQLRSDLREYFQVPVHMLNEQTRGEWQQTLSDARWGFRVRMAMSVVVFVVGVFLIVASSVQFLFGSLDAMAAWGAGVSFVGGLSAMLLVVYSGPLRDIRDAVRDLGSSNAVFIAYVHRVLQASHTFSALYLREKMTLDDAERTARLMQDAMQASIAALQVDPKASKAED